MSSAPEGWVDLSEQVSAEVSDALKASDVSARWRRVETWHAIGTGMGWDGILVHVVVLWPADDDGYTTTVVQGRFRAHELGLIPERMVQLVRDHIEETA